MKVVSINAEKTVGFKQIAFNLDTEISPEFVAKIHYGSLKITGTGTVLVVQLPPESDTPFTSESVKTLNEKLQEIEDEYAVAAEKHANVLRAIANNTGLPLA